MAYEVNHVHIKAPDPGKTADWFVKAFNFRIIGDEARSVGDRFIRCMAPGDTPVNISGARTNERLGKADATAHWGLEHLGVNVDDMDAELERLEGLGAELIEGPADMPNGIRIAFIKTPDDVRMELVQPAP